MRFRVLAAILALGAAATQAQTYKILHNFSGIGGVNPNGNLLFDKKGNIYGSLRWGAAYDYGAVYKLDKKGAETVLYNFCPTGDQCTDGANPAAGMAWDEQGTLYGADLEGGYYRKGVVFKLDTNGRETVLHSFAGGTKDGCTPVTGLLRDKAGNLYGVTGFCGASGNGTVFKLDTAGTYTIMHNFTGGDGRFPVSGLTIDKHGNLYGTTFFGGTGNCYSGYGPGCGAVYKLSKSGLLTVLYNFAGGTTDGCSPVGIPAIDKNGDLYGVTLYCGSTGLGTAWKLSKKGVETVLHNFVDYPSDGAFPQAVIIGQDGNLYGDTYNGGLYTRGMIFRLS